ncbi:MAG: hypothetical protein ACRDG7_02540, partial [Candidatus Limnocylindria bacterium]
MVIRRYAAILAIVALVLTACTDDGAGESQAAESQAAESQPEEPAGSEAAGGDCTVAVSWNNFQQPRWAAKDKPNIQETVEAGGGTYIDADANLDTVQQLT